MLEDRIVNIETRIAFQEDMIDELNKVVYQQQQKLNQLEALCKSLARQIQSQDEAGNAGNLDNEPPPHY